MLTWEDCVEAQALRTRGWSISAIATHLGHDRKTIRAYLNGERRPGERKPVRPQALEEFVGYCRPRLAHDPHLWSTTLFDEVVELGYRGSYQALTARSPPGCAATGCGHGARRARRPRPATGR
jgi:transposase